MTPELLAQVFALCHLDDQHIPLTLSRLCRLASKGSFFPPFALPAATALAPPRYPPPPARHQSLLVLDAHEVLRLLLGLFRRRRIRREQRGRAPSRCRFRILDSGFRG